MRFSERSSAEHAPNAVSLAVLERRHAGAPLIDLTSGNPTQAGIPYDREALTRALTHERWLRYEPDPRGPRFAREAICSALLELGHSVSPEKLLITASTSEAYSYLFKLLADPGDELLIPSPSYPLFEHLARFEGIRPVPYPLAFDGAWHIDFAATRARLTPRTRALVTVNPNNPTGHFIREDELRALSELELPIISDEVFNAFPLDKPRRAVTSLLEARALVTEREPVPSRLTFVLSGLSKFAGLPQVKLSWIVVDGPAQIAEEALERLELIADTFLSPSAPVLLALPELLSLGRAQRARIQERITENAQTLRELSKGTPLTPLPIEGGWYAVIRLPRTLPEETWVLTLLRERGVLVQPGYFFDFDDEPFVIVSLVTERAEFRRGITLLAEHVGVHAP